jgi:carbonic anhydrase/acetyltransferase-like protein (isoleucine patch superfamily)
MIATFKRSKPRIHQTAFVHSSAQLIGRVVIARDASIWPTVVLRGDIEPIVIGPQSNVQDGSICHTSLKLPVVVGRGVTVGHGAIVHGARVGDYCLIGMGAILLDGCVFGRECLVGAGTLVREGMRVPARSVVLGVPGRVVRKVTPAEIRLFHRRAQDYLRYARDHESHSRPVEISSCEA